MNKCNIAYSPDSCRYYFRQSNENKYMPLRHIHLIINLDNVNSVTIKFCISKFEFVNLFD